MSTNMEPKDKFREDLARAAYEWQITFDATNDAIWILDRQQRILRSNKSAERLFGLPHSEMIGKLCWEIAHGTPGPNPGCPILRVRYSLCRETMDLRIGERWVQVKVDPILDEHGEYAGAVHIVTDITERKQAEEETKRLLIQAEQAHDAVLHMLQDREQAEQALKETQELYRSLFEQSPDGVFILDLEGRHVEVNSRASDLLGYTRQELLALSTWDTSVQVEQSRQVLHRLLQGEHVAPYERLFRHKDGSLVPVELHVSLIRDQQGQPRCIQSIARDIAARKQAERALQESEASLARAQQIAHLGSWDWDIERGTLTWSDEIYRILGVDKGFALTYESIEAMIHPDDRARNQEFVDELLRGAVLAEVEFRIVRPDGSVRHIYQNAQVQRDLAGHASRIFGTMQDVSERNQVKAALQVSLEKYRVLFETFPMGITVSDRQGNIVEANRTSERLLGLATSEHTRRTIDGDEWRMIRPDGTEMPPDEYASVRALRENRPVENVEMGIVKSTGGVTWLSVTATPLPLKDYGVVVAYSDISERRQAEEALRSSREQLRALASYLCTAQEKERTRIAREAHDEFGQALTALKIDLTWLNKRLPQNDPLSDKVRDMIALVDDTIQMVRRIATELRPGLLDDLGLGAALDWQAEEFARRTGIMCRIDLDQEALTGALSDLDRDLSTAIFRIFQEALTNVARHAHATAVDVSLRQVQDVLILTVRDNGIGMAPEMTADPHSLGLLGMRERALFWQGSVSIEGVPGQGTIVTLRVPYLSGAGSVRPRGE